MRKSVSMDQSCELAAVDEPDDVMEEDTKADKDEGMVGGDLTFQCASHKWLQAHMHLVHMYKWRTGDWW